jgi:hypothetical protein
MKNIGLGFFIVQNFILFGVLPIIFGALAIKFSKYSNFFIFLASVSVLIGGILFGIKLGWEIIPTICSFLPSALVLFFGLTRILPWLRKR